MILNSRSLNLLGRAIVYRFHGSSRGLILALACSFVLSIPILESRVQPATASETTTVPTTIIKYGDTGYRYKVVSWGELAGFEQPNFDDSTFLVGDAHFGQGCGSVVKTPWPVNTDILVRKKFRLPAGSRNLKLGIAIDNDVQCYLNGIDVSGFRQHDGCATNDSFIFAAPDLILKQDGENLIAVRGRDRGAVAYLDLQVTADIPANALVSVSPSRGGNAGLVTLRIIGAGLDQAAGVRLRSLEEPEITGFTLNAIGRDTLLATFALQAAAAGVRDVVVTFASGESAVLNSAFEVIDGGGGRFETAVLGPGVVRAGRTTTFMVIVRNIGLNDLGVFSVKATVSRAGTNLEKGARLSQASLANTALTTAASGLPPGGAQEFPFPVVLQDCSSINAQADLPPDDDPCFSIRLQIAKLREDIEILEGNIVKAWESFYNLECDQLTDDLLCIQLAELIARLEARFIERFEELRHQEHLLAECEERTGTSQFRRRILSTSTTGLSVCPVFSWDPNDKVGVAGAGQGNYIRAASPMTYTVYVENKAQASAPAQDVLITDPLDTNLDWTTLLLDSIRFADRRIEVPKGLQNFKTVVDLRPERNLLVRIEAGLNLSNGLLKFKFTSIDPNTGQPPEDPLEGFLNPNRNPPDGEAAVSFTIKPKENLPTNSRIKNSAEIVFDNNPKIVTSEWNNLVDNSAPTSKVELMSQLPCGTFELGWSGTDNGSGIASYDVFVSENGGPFLLWQSNAVSTSATFQGESGKTYSFFSLARDSVGNIENLKASGDITLASIDNQPPTIEGAWVDPPMLWPPNHRMVDVTIAYNVTDNCDLQSELTRALTISSNEPIDASDDGDRAPDWEVIDAHHVRLRAERAGNGTGRIYTITITVKDRAGNSTQRPLTVIVPHNRR